MAADAELEKILDIFKQLDADNDGTLCVTELKELITGLDNSMGEPAEKLLKAMDVNNDSRVSFEEFLSFLWSDQMETKEVTGGVLSVADQSPDMTQVESETLELSRDIILLDRLIASFSESERAAMSFESCTLASWAEVENSLRTPATEMLRFLQRGGSLPKSLHDALIRQPRGMSNDWSRVVQEGAGGYLLDKSGAKRVAVYQLLGLVSPGTAAVRLLDDGIKEVPSIASLAQKRDGRHVVQVDRANPELILIKPTLLAAQLASLGRWFDEVTEMLQKRRGSRLEVDYPAPVRLCPPVTLMSSPKTVEDLQEKTELEKATEEFAQDLHQLGEHIKKHERKGTKFLLVANPEPSFEEFVTEFDRQYPKQYWSERLGAWEPLPKLFLDRIRQCQKEDYKSYLHWLADNNYEKGTFQPNWEKVNGLFNRSKTLNLWMENGGEVPGMFQSTLLSRRTLKKVWGGSATANQCLDGGYLVTKDMDKLPHHAVFQVTSLRGNSAQVRKLPGSSWPRRIASKDATAGWTINVTTSVKLLDMITPTTLTACCYELMGQMKSCFQAKEALQGKEYPAFELMSLQQLVQDIIKDTSWHGLMVWQEETSSLQLQKEQAPDHKTLLGGKLSVVAR